jgi:hypothetical protein
VHHRFAVLLLHGDVIHQQPNHALALLGAGGLGTPEAREVLRQAKNTRLLLEGERAGVLAPMAVELLIELGGSLQRFIPAPF